MCTTTAAAVHAAQRLGRRDAVAPPIFQTAIFQTAIFQTAIFQTAIFQTATFQAHTAQEFARGAVEPRGRDFYARYGNPNHAQTTRSPGSRNTGRSS